ncbi:RNA polymerase sigma factor [Planctomycetota bacterium]|nr:RNA polymerase sigma factor [Planctomycetota bacterium]
MHEHQILIDLMQTHQADVWRFLRFLGADASLADDLTQETFLYVYRNPIKEISPAATRAYLHKTAKHRLFNARRKDSRLVELDEAEQVWNTETAESSDDRIGALRSCIEKLTERARRAVGLKYEKSLTEPEVASELDTSTDAIKALLKRTRAQLRECVQKAQVSA